MSEPGAHRPAGTEQPHHRDDADGADAADGSHGAGEAHPSAGAEGSGGVLAGAVDGADGATGPQGWEETRRERRRGPDRRLLWVLLGVAAVAVVLTVVLLVTNGRQPPEAAPTLDPEIVTLPVPTPTVEPAELPEGTTFFEALPRAVLQYVVTDAPEAPEILQAGALEAYRLEFDDGDGAGFTFTASQWRDADGAASRLADVVAEQSAEAGTEPSAPAEPTDGSADAPADESADPADPADEPAGTDDAGDATEDGAGTTGTAAPTEDPATEPRLEEGPVTVDGAEAGRYLLRVREDGSASIWWTNATALFRLDGPADVLRDVYAAFPL